MKKHPPQDLPPPLFLTLMVLQKILRNFIGLYFMPPHCLGIKKSDI